MEGAAAQADRRQDSHGSRSFGLIVILFAAVVYLIACASPPSLMDDVDAVQAQIARNMLESGDWVTARLNGVVYLEKSPLVYWLMALSFAAFGVHDWAARLPIALSAVALAWLTYRIGRWAFGAREGLYAGLAVATCIGLFLFTRILIPDVILTGTITLAMWALLRALDDEEQEPRLWGAAFAASIGVGLLLKGLIAAVFPIAAAGLYLLFTGQLFAKKAWQRIGPFSGIAIILLIAGPWHVVATLRNPPYFDLTPRSEPGQYHGFFWFYFLNEHVFRFLNMRHPRDYNTVPRYLFWLFHLLWLFPWSAFLPGLTKLTYRGNSRADRTRLLALCLVGFVLVFFTFSTTQEYYSMPIYPAVALLLACAMACEGVAMRAGAIVLGVVGTLAFAAIVYILTQVWGLPTPGDISNALVTQDFEAYTLSLGHMGDLTLRSFAYLRPPLMMAGGAFALLAYAGFRWRGQRLYVGLAIGMVLFLNAARLAMITFDPYLSSRRLAEALAASPDGRLIVDNQYYTFSSVFFYAGDRASSPDRRALLLNGRVTNLEYGSYAPGAPDVFITDADLPSVWSHPLRHYLLIEGPQLARVQALVGAENLHAVASSGGKHLFTNHPIGEIHAHLH
jgi:4-amino-4-deoxy-L-arabinose transferase-like glycosyltransferase